MGANVVDGLNVFEIVEEHRVNLGKLVVALPGIRESLTVILVGGKRPVNKLFGSSKEFVGNLCLEGAVRPRYSSNRKCTEA